MDLRLLISFAFIIRKLRLAVIVCFAFFHEEYRIAPVDFIYSSRGRLERDRGFANPLSLSNTSPDPYGYPLRRGILAAAVYANIGFLYPVQVVYRQFRILFGCFVFGLVSHAFQLVLFGLYRLFFIIGWKKTLFVYPFLLVF